MSDKTDKATVFEFAARYVHFLKGFVGNQHDKVMSFSHQVIILCFTFCIISHVYLKTTQSFLSSPIGFPSEVQSVLSCIENANVLNSAAGHKKSKVPYLAEQWTIHGGSFPRFLYCSAGHNWPTQRIILTIYIMKDKNDVSIKHQCNCFKC